MDFGIVQVMRSKSDDKPIVHGTPLYMAPEQILSREVDGRADIYAVATMFYQMLVTKLPLPQFKSKPALLKEKVLNKNGIFLQWPSQVNPALHEDLDPILQKALAYSPDERYATCNDFREDLIEYQKNHLG
jgi:serine/threonine-protein kinase